MELQPWAHRASSNLTLRGWHSPPSGRPLLHFLHGNGFCGRAYQPMLERLAEHFDLWLCDLQGHGDSDHGGPFLGWNRNAELAVEAFEAGRGIFGEAPRHACGHSFGGVLTGLILAEHPQLFERAVLLDPVIFPPVLARVLRVADAFGLRRRRGIAQRALGRRSQWEHRELARRSLHNRGIYKGWEEDALDAFITHALRDQDGGVALKCHPSREAEIFSSSPQRLWYSLRRVQTATRLIYGEQSYPFVARSARHWAGINRHVTVARLPGGHCFMQEDPATSAEQVRSFLLDTRP